MDIGFIINLVINLVLILVLLNQARILTKAIKRVEIATDPRRVRRIKGSNYMYAIVQYSTTKRAGKKYNLFYYQGSDVWSKDPDKAMLFYSTAKAEECIDMMLTSNRRYHILQTYVVGRIIRR